MATPGRTLTAMLLAACLTAAMSAAQGPTTATDAVATLSDLAQRLTDAMERGQTVRLDALRKQLEPYRSCLLKLDPPSAVTKTASEIYAASRDSVVIIGKLFNCGKCNKWHATCASGFVLRSDGIVCTTYHVLAQDDRTVAMGVLCRDGRLLQVQRVMACSQDDDLLVLQVNANDLRALPVATGATVGSRVYCLWHQPQHLYVLTEGLVCGYFQRPRYVDMAISADFARGASGAPVLDQTGAVAGVARATAPAYYDAEHKTDSYEQMVWKYAIPSERLLQLLGTNVK